MSTRREQRRQQKKTSALFSKEKYTQLAHDKEEQKDSMEVAF
jgi:hypothetical protein